MTFTPVNSPGVITVVGTSAQGETLSASLVDDDGYTLGTETYEWFSGGTSISTAQNIVLTQAEVGSPLRVVVSYTDGFGSGQTATRMISGVVDTDDPGIVTISGTATQGQLLTATLADADGSISNISYQWLAGSSVIVGATGDTYTLTQAEVGRLLL